jgi:signal transduction histidine kinase
MAFRMLAFVLLSIAFVTILGYLGAAVLGVATAPVGAVVVGILVVIGLGVAAALTFRAVRRAGRPLDRLIDAAARVEAGEYSVRVPEDGPADLRGLERAFNQMSARLEAAESARRAFLADVSHELRTPLTVIRGQLEAIADGVYPADSAHLAPVLAQADLLERLVDDLRTVALAESGALAVRREPVELATLAASVAAGFSAAAADAGVRLAAVPAGLPPVPADPALLRRVLGNLVANALRHTPRGGSVRLEVADAGPGWQRLTVSDSGPGIPADLLPRVFERFVKGPGSEGTGLGLAIARDLVLAHGGTIAARVPPEGGTRIEIELPSGR